jgi:hypothetical protein
LLKEAVLRDMDMTLEQDKQSTGSAMIFIKTVPFVHRILPSLSFSTSKALEFSTGF